MRQELQPDAHATTHRALKTSLKAISWPSTTSGPSSPPLAPLNASSSFAASFPSAALLNSPSSLNKSKLNAASIPSPFCLAKSRYAA